MSELIKADLHIHTEYSVDCNTPLPRIIERCQEIGIDCIAVADHGTIEGALRMQEIAPFTVIVAEEIRTPHGEIMGIFLKEGIPNGLPLAETISRIKAQGGLVGVPHPFDTLRGIGAGNKILEELVEKIDVIEVFNSRSLFLQASTKAQVFAQKYDIPGSAGSDAHTLNEIGNAYVEMPEFNGRDDFLQALRNGKIFGRKSGLLVHFSSSWTRLKKQF